MNLRRLLSWCFFDWALSVWPTIVNAFVISYYFANQVASDPVSGTILWGYQTAIVGFILALTSPVLGAMLDKRGGYGFWVSILTGLSSFSALMLYWAYPHDTYVLYTLIFCALGTFSTELAFVPYNSSMGFIFKRNNWEKASSWGYSLGYLSGFVSMVVVLYFFVLNPEFLNFDVKTHQNIRAIGPFIAVWMMVFSMPLLKILFQKEQSTNTGGLFVDEIKDVLWNVVKTIREIKKHHLMAVFLLAHMLFIDGLNTVFAFAGIYAGNIYGMGLQEVMFFGVLSQLFAGVGAWLNGWAESKYSSVNVLTLSLIFFSIAACFIIVSNDKKVFYICGLFCSSLIGPIQSASRTLVTIISAPSKRSEMFGYLSLSGKITAFLGPLLMSLVTSYFHSQRAGMASALVLFILGMLLFLYFSFLYNKKNCN